MSIKDYKKGIADQAAIHAEGERRNEIILRQLVADSSQWRDRQGNLMEAVVAELSTEEKKKQYGISTDFDLADASRDDQEFVVALLHEIANNHSKSTGAQQLYLNSLHSYLGILDIQRENVLDAITNIDSKKVERAILQCVFEYLFLENNDYSFMNDNRKDIIERFCVPVGAIEDIQARIDSFCKALGPYGLAQKYSFKDPISSEGKKTPATFLIRIVPDETDRVKTSTSREKMAKRLKEWLDSSQNNCELVPQQIYERAGGKTYNYTILLGKNELTDRILGIDAWETVLDAYGCTIKIQPKSNRLVVSSNAKFKVTSENQRSEFIQYYERTCTSQKDTTVNDSAAKRAARSRSPQQGEKKSLTERIFEIPGHLIDRITDDSVAMPFQILSMLVAIPFSLATFVLGFATMIPEVLVTETIEKLKNSNFDSKFVLAAQEDILLVKTVEYIREQQIRQAK